jgi:hypothetical protein
MRPFRPAVTASAALAALACALVLVGAAPAPKNLERALAAQRQLAAERPNDGSVLNDLGNLLALAGDTRGAAEAYGKAIALSPEDPAPHFNYGLLLVESGKRYAAWRQFRATVKLEPRHAWAWYQLGSLYESFKLESRARRAFARAFALDHRLADARYNPAVLDNPQATPAMLMAWRAGGSASTSAPRGYAEGSRIAGLLIDVPKKPADSESAPAEESGDHAASEGGGFAHSSAVGGGPVKRPEGAGDGTGGSAWGDQGEAGSGTQSDEPRVITGADLRQPRPINQLSSPSGMEDAQRKGTFSRGRPGFVAPRPRPYVPGRNSTGRLEPLLVPPAGASDPFDLTAPVDPQAG